MESSNTNKPGIIELIKPIVNTIGDKFTTMTITVSDFFNKYILVTMMVLYSYIVEPRGKQDMDKIIKYVVFLCSFLVLISIFTISIPYYIYKMETSGKEAKLSGKYKEYLDTYITTLIWVGIILLIMLLSYFVQVMGYVSNETLKNILTRLIGVSGLGLTGASFISIIQALPFINIKRCMII